MTSPGPSWAHFSEPPSTNPSENESSPSTSSSASSSNADTNNKKPKIIKKKKKDFKTDDNPKPVPTLPNPRPPPPITAGTKRKRPRETYPNLASNGNSTRDTGSKPAEEDKAGYSAEEVKRLKEQMRLLQRQWKRPKLAEEGDSSASQVNKEEEEEEEEEEEKGSRMRTAMGNGLPTPKPSSSSKSASSSKPSSISATVPLFLPSTSKSASASASASVSSSHKTKRVKRSREERTKRDWDNEDEEEEQSISSHRVHKDREREGRKQTQPDNSEASTSRTKIQALPPNPHSTQSNSNTKPLSKPRPPPNVTNAPNSTRARPVVAEADIGGRSTEDAIVVDSSPSPSPPPPRHPIPRLPALSSALPNASASAPAPTPASASIRPLPPRSPSPSGSPPPISTEVNLTSNPIFKLNDPHTDPHSFSFSSSSSRARPLSLFGPDIKLEKDLDSPPPIAIGGKLPGAGPPALKRVRRSTGGFPLNGNEKSEKGKDKEIGSGKEGGTNAVIVITDSDDEKEVQKEKQKTISTVVSQPRHRAPLSSSSLSKSKPISNSTSRPKPTSSSSSKPTSSSSSKPVSKPTSQKSVSNKLPNPPTSHNPSKYQFSSTVTSKPRFSEPIVISSSDSDGDADKNVNGKEKGEEKGEETEKGKENPKESTKAQERKTPEPKSQPSLFLPESSSSSSETETNISHLPPLSLLIPSLARPGSLPSEPSKRDGPKRAGAIPQADANGHNNSGSDSGSNAIADAHNAKATTNASSVKSSNNDTKGHRSSSTNHANKNNADKDNIHRLKEKQRKEHLNGEKKKKSNEGNQMWLQSLADAFEASAQANFRSKAERRERRERDDSRERGTRIPWKEKGKEKETEGTEKEKEKKKVQVKVDEKKNEGTSRPPVSLPPSPTKQRLKPPTTKPSAPKTIFKGFNPAKIFNQQLKLNSKALRKPPPLPHTRARARAGTGPHLNRTENFGTKQNHAQRPDTSISEDNIDDDELLLPDYEDDDDGRKDDQHQGNGKDRDGVENDVPGTFPPLDYVEDDDVDMDKDGEPSMSTSNPKPPNGTSSSSPITSISVVGSTENSKASDPHLSTSISPHHNSHDPHSISIPKRALNGTFHVKGHVPQVEAAPQPDIPRDIPEPQRQSQPGVVLGLAPRPQSQPVSETSPSRESIQGTATNLNSVLASSALGPSTVDGVSTINVVGTMKTMDTIGVPVEDQGGQGKPKANSRSPTESEKSIKSAGSLETGDSESYVQNILDAGNDPDNSSASTPNSSISPINIIPNSTKPSLHTVDSTLTIPTNPMKSLKQELQPPADTRSREVLEATRADARARSRSERNEVDGIGEGRKRKRRSLSSSQSSSGSVDSGSASDANACTGFDSDSEAVSKAASEKVMIRNHSRASLPRATLPRASLPGSSLLRINKPTLPRINIPSGSSGTRGRSMSPRSDSEKTNTGRASLPRRVSPSRRATLPEASLPQRPSLPRKTKSTFPRSSRSPSQSSSGYSSYEHFVYGLGYSSESDHDVRTKNTAEHTPPPPFSGTIASSSSSSSSTPPLPTPPTLGGFPITTWSHTRSLLRNTPPPHRFSSETLFSNAEGKGAGGHTMHDYINAYGSHMRAYPQMRVVYEAMMRENTSWDEPDAPRIRICGEDDEDYLRDDAARDEGNKVEVTPPWEFYYTNEMLLGQGVLPPSRSQLTGCDCEGGRCHLNRNKCSCWKKQETFTAGYGVSGFMYEALQEGGNGNGVVLKANGLPVFECNSLCGCGEECRNRVVSRGRKVPITLKKTHKKGWGVFASSVIPKGTFIGIYSGELLGHEESEERAIKYDEFGRTYLFDIDWWYIDEQLDAQEAREKENSQQNADSHSQPGKTRRNSVNANSDSDSDSDTDHPKRRPSKYTIDAYHAGNFTRFLNHSCDPNAALTPVYIDVDEIERPLLTIFSKRRIRPGEEITFSYSGDPDMDEDENEPKDDKEDHDDDYRHHVGKKTKRMTILNQSPHNRKSQKAQDENIKGDARVHVSCQCGAANCKGTIWRS